MRQINYVLYCCIFRFVSNGSLFTQQRLLHLYTDTAMHTFAYMQLISYLFCSFSMKLPWMLNLIRWIQGHAVQCNLWKSSAGDLWINWECVSVCLCSHVCLILIILNVCRGGVSTDGVSPNMKPIILWRFTRIRSS